MAYDRLKTPGEGGWWFKGPLALAFVGAIGLPLGALLAGELPEMASKGWSGLKDILHFLSGGTRAVLESHLHEAIIQTFHEQLAEIRIKTAIGEVTLPSLLGSHTSVQDALAAGGFDYIKADGSSTRFIIEFNENGTVKDIRETTMPGFGNGPFFKEDMDDMDPNERFDWYHQSRVYDRPPMTQEQYDAAVAYYSSPEYGARPFRDTVDDISKADEAKVQSGVRRYNSTRDLYLREQTEQIFNAIRAEGGFVDDTGRAWQIWVHPTRGPLFVPLPPGEGLHLPRFNDHGIWTVGGTRIEPQWR